jgi:hypothetical protein
MPLLEQHSGEHAALLAGCPTYQYRKLIRHG